MTKQMNSKIGATKKRDPGALVIPGQPGDDEATLLAQAVLRSSVRAAISVTQYVQGFGVSNLDLTALTEELAKQANAITAGDLGRSEAMLSAQAHTLDAIFNSMARRAALNANEYPGACDTFLRLALKAQSQCRATLETLAALKNPRSVAFVRQANIAAGPQQVNNGSLAREIETRRTNFWRRRMANG